MVGNNTINKVNKDIAVANLIEKYIEIIPKGRDFKAICPFHDDTNPSMSISVEKNIWKCFSCGVSGRAVDFVMKYEKVDLINALKIIEKKMNYKIDFLQDENQKKYSEEQLKILKINGIVRDIYANFLRIDVTGEDAREYLKKRQFTMDDIVKYELGYASSKFNVYDHFIEKEYAEKDILDTMLVNTSTLKKYNFFNDRIIFPIFDIDNNVVGFSGRLYKKDNKDLPKYINTKENKVFQKKDILYNLNRAKISAQSKKEIFITEGFTDVFSMDKVGIENVVATMGTALTSSHVQSLVNLKINNMILFFDGDSAGVKATIEAIDACVAHFNVFIVCNETNKDPNELVESNQLYEIATTNRIRWFDFILKKTIEKYNLKDEIECEDFINKMFSYVYKSNEKTKSNNIEYFEKISKAVNKSFNIIESKFGFYQKEKDVLKISKKRSIENSEHDEDDIFIDAFLNDFPKSKPKKREKEKKQLYSDDYLKELICILIHTNAYNTEIKKVSNKIINPIYRDIVNKIISWYNINSILDKNEIINKLKDENLYSQIESSFISYENLNRDLSINNTLVRNIISKIHIEHIEKEIEELKKLISENDSDPEIVNSISEKLQKEIIKREKLKTKG